MSAVAVESGKRRHAAFRWACDKRLRGALATLANSSRHHNPWAGDLYAAARARGHDHQRAIRTDSYSVSALHSDGLENR